MEPKKLYFVIATAGFLSGAGVKTVADYVPGVDNALMSSALAGENSFETYSFKLDSIPVPIMGMITNYLTNTVCPTVSGRLGDGVCDPATVPFRIVLSRDRLLRDSVDGKVSHMPIFKTARPPAEPVPPEDP